MNIYRLTKPVALPVLLSVAVVAVIAGCATTDHTLEMYVTSPPLTVAQIAAMKGVAVGMEVRVYPVTPETFSRFVTNTESMASIESLFTEAGGKFPEGSFAKYDRDNSRVVVKNTAENLKDFERLLGSLCCEQPKQIEAEAKLLEVSDERATTVLKRRPISLARLSKLTGQGIQIVDSTRTVTISGVQAEIKNCTGKATGEVEQCSSRLTFTSTVGSDGYTLNLALTWDGRLTADQRGGIATSFTVWDGQTVAFEVPTPKESTGHHYWLLFTVRLVDFSGTPIHAMQN